MAADPVVERAARALCALAHFEPDKCWHMFVPQVEIVMAATADPVPAPFSTSMAFAINDQRVTLALTFWFVPGSPARGPSYSSGGEPADPPEVDIATMEWSRVPNGRNIHCHKWHKIEPGPLFALIAEDDEIYQHCCAVAEAKLAEGEIRF